MADYIRYTRGEVDHYIRPDLFNELSSREGGIASVHPMQILQVAEYVVDTKKNELIKCRQTLDNVLSTAFDITPATVAGEQVVQSLLALRDELLEQSTGNRGMQEIVMKINSCLYRKYPTHG